MHMETKSMLLEMSQYQIFPNSHQKIVNAINLIFFLMVKINFSQQTDYNSKNKLLFNKISLLLAFSFH